MTNKEKAQVLRLLMKQQNKCYICQEHIHEYKYGTQRAHRHSRSKTNINKYGIEKVNSDANIVMVCSLECNHRAALGESSMKQKDDFFRGGGL